MIYLILCDFTKDRVVLCKKKRLDTVSNLYYLNGGANGVRTRDLIVANDALSQLSYSPNAEQL